MPPVLGPWSLSKTRLWSWDGTIGRIVLPSVKHSTETSSPAMNSSTTTRLPALPKALSPMISSMAPRASSSVMATITPLPAASPSALMTIGAPSALIYALAASASVNTSYLAVGILYFFMRFFEKDLEPSISAAACTGPKALIPAALKASTAPLVNGTSGPTTASSTFFSCASLTRAALSVMDTPSMHSASSAIPGLPGTA